MQPAGRRDTKIAFWRSTPVQAGAGQVKASWEPIAKGAAWARVFWGSGQERREAAQQQASQTASFVVLANAVTRGITTRDRIVGAGGNWDITGFVPFGDEEIEFTAKRAA